MDIANPVVIERAYKKLSFREWPASSASAAGDFDESADETTRPKDREVFSGAGQIK